MDDIIAILLKGLVAEKQFFEAVKNPRLLPNWLGEIWQATPEQDALGIDAFATVIHPKNGTIIVPIQVKTGYQGVVKYHLEWPESYQMRIPVIIVRRYHSPEQICRMLVDLLRHVYFWGYNYNEFLLDVVQYQFSPEFASKIKLWTSQREAALKLLEEPEENPILDHSPNKVA